jgi:hypothetical protein
MKPETIAIIAAAALFITVLLRQFWKADGRSPNPWSAEIEAELCDGSSSPLCLKCLAAQSGNDWFCPKCGAPVGDYNNWMPYMTIFSDGELLRSGVNSSLRKSPLVIAGYLLYSLNLYTVFAPLYWWRLYQNYKRQQNFSERRDEEN